MPLPTTNFFDTLQVIQLASREGGATFAEIQEKTGFTRRQVTELNDIFDEVKIPPYCPDDIMYFTVKGNHVEILFHLNLARPLNLSSHDILALNLAIKWGTLENLIEPGIAASISHKINAARPGTHHAFEMDGVHIEVADDTPRREFLVPLSQAVQEHRYTQLNYFSQHRGETSWRYVAPFHLYFREGVWYLRAYEADPPSGRPAWRTYRLDRIHEVEVKEEIFNPELLPHPEEGGKLFVFEDGAKTTTRTRFNSGTARFIREMAPASQIEELEGGALILDYAVAGFPYFKTFVLQYGADAEVLEPEQFRVAIADQLERLL